MVLKKIEERKKGLNAITKGYEIEMLINTKYLFLNAF